MKVLNGLSGVLAASMLPLTFSNAHAQSALDQIERRLSRAIEEQRVFLTCARLERSTWKIASESWADIVATTRGMLVNSHASANELASFDARTRVASLIESGRTYAEIIEFCDRHSDWMNRFTRLKFIYVIDGSPPPAE